MIIIIFINVWASNSSKLIHKLQDIRVNLVVFKFRSVTECKMFNKQRLRVCLHSNEQFERYFGIVIANGPDVCEVAHGYIMGKIYGICFFSSKRKTRATGLSNFLINTFHERMCWVYQAWHLMGCCAPPSPSFQAFFFNA